MYKIITVCGLGVGSSLILKMTVDTVMTQLGIECIIQHWDMGTVKGIPCDMIVTTESFREKFEGNDKVIFVKNIMDVNEIKEKISVFLKTEN